jgi:hypothetical protein
VSGVSDSPVSRSAEISPEAPATFIDSQLRQRGDVAGHAGERALGVIYLDRPAPAHGDQRAASGEHWLRRETDQNRAEGRVESGLIRGPARGDPNATDKYTRYRHAGLMVGRSPLSI